MEIGDIDVFDTDFSDFSLIASPFELMGLHDSRLPDRCDPGGPDVAVAGDQRKSES